MKIKLAAFFGLVISSLGLSACNGNTNSSFSENSLMGRGRKLAENINKIPSSASLLNQEETTEEGPKHMYLSPKRRNTDNFVDMTNKDENFYSSPERDHRLVPTQILHYDVLDSNIHYVTKDLKPRIIDTVRQLGIWVGEGARGDSETRYRMTYDINTDTVKLESVNKYDNRDRHGDYGVVYYCIYSTYNAEGKACVKATRQTYKTPYFYNAPYYSTMSMEYIEDDYYRFSCYEPIEGTRGERDETGALIIEEPTVAKLILLEKDFHDEKEALAIDYLQIPINQAANISSEYTYVIHRRFWNEFNLIFYENSVQVLQDDGSLRDGGREYYIGDGTGKMIAVADNKGSIAYINLYYVDGWSNFYRDMGNEETSRLVINNVDVEFEGTKVRPGIQQDLLLDTTQTETPTLKNIGMNNDGTSQTAAQKGKNLDDFLADHNLTSQIGSLEQKFTYMDNYVENAMHYGKGYFDDITMDFIVESYEEMKMTKEYSENELRGMFNQQFVHKDKQTVDNSTVELFTVSVDGQPALTSNNIDLSNVAFTLNRNALLKEGDVIELRMLNKSAFETIDEKVLATVTFNGEAQLRLSIPADFNLADENLLEGESHVMFYLAKQNGMRISDFSEVTSTSELTSVNETAEYITTIKVDDKGITVTKEAVPQA